jgi:hypothetical protein
MESITLSRRGAFRKVLGAVACVFAGAGSVSRDKGRIDDAGPGSFATESGVTRLFDEFGRLVYELRPERRAHSWTHFYYG